MNQRTLNNILHKHQKWIWNELDGKCANLSGAILRGTKLSNTKLSEATVFLALQCPEKGSFVAFKKADEYIIELEILADAKRSSATSRKCRCNKAKVISITSVDETEEIEHIPSDYNNNFIYRVGEIVEVTDFEEDRWKECAAGIHFFITRDEAVNY